MDVTQTHLNLNWLNEVLEEVGLQQFYSKLTIDLQLTKLSHFDFVSEEDLIQLGLSRPAAKRLLAAIKKRKSFVTALKNKIVNRLVPSSSSSSSTFKARSVHETFFGNAPEDNVISTDNSCNSSDFGRLTCLINSQDVQIKEDIGHGVHGFVKKGEWTAPNGRVIEVALKILRKDVMSEPGAPFNDFVKEISVMHQLNHPNIIKLFGIVLSSPMMMVTELAPFGNLRDRLRKENGKTPISQLINFSIQISSGMEYLESRRFVHRDLAARNIFISHGKKILIGDLGLMRAIPCQENHYVMSEKTKIPYPWCAPESLKNKQFSSASDVYMFGVTLWEMFSFGKEPWAGLSLADILESISSQRKRLQCPEACPSMVYQTLLQCWDTDPSCRPNFHTLYQYLSTSYPLEVRSTQHISELGQKRQNGKLLPDDLSNSSSSSHSESLDLKKSHRQVLTCRVDDRILVIDGQPEKYWWKGQNQRTYDVGWFPLCSTRWLAPKLGSNYISKPLKNSFVHAGHCGADAKWGSPRFIDYIYLGNNPDSEDISSRNVNQSSNRFPFPNDLPKPKSKSRLSKLFGINETIHSPAIIVNNLSSQTYNKFVNEKKTNFKNEQEYFSTTLVRSQSLELNEKPDNEAPLIDLSDDSAIPNSQSLVCSNLLVQEESLLDINLRVPVPPDPNVLKHSSEVDLNKVGDLDDYHSSWAGSWNTGTFEGSESNIYSAYYCPNDAEVTRVVEPIDGNRYYSAVSHEETRRG